MHELVSRPHRPARDRRRAGHGSRPSDLPGAESLGLCLPSFARDGQNGTGLGHRLVREVLSVRRGGKRSRQIPGCPSVGRLPGNHPGGHPHAQLHHAQRLFGVPRFVHHARLVRHGALWKGGSVSANRKDPGHPAHLGSRFLWAPLSTNPLSEPSRRNSFWKIFKCSSREEWGPRENPNGEARRRFLSFSC